MMFSFVKKLLGLETRFNSIEMVVLHAFAQHLPADCREPWIARLNKVNLVRRIIEGREVDCYEKSNGQVVFDPAGRLFESNEELLFGKMMLAFSDADNVDVELWVVRGYFFSMEFSAPMKNKVVSDLLDLKLVHGPVVPAR